MYINMNVQKFCLVLHPHNIQTHVCALLWRYFNMKKKKGLFTFFFLCTLLNSSGMVMFFYVFNCGMRDKMVHAAPGTTK